MAYIAIFQKSSGKVFMSAAHRPLVIQTAISHVFNLKRAHLNKLLVRRNGSSTSLLLSHVMKRVDHLRMNRVLEMQECCDKCSIH